MTTRQLRNLDAAIAEKVMGWQHLEFTRDNGSKFVHFMSRESVNIPHILSRNPRLVPNGDEANAPFFSTSPVANKQLRDKLSSNGWDYELSLFGSMFAFGLIERGAITHHVAMTANTEELAVTLCVAKAYDIEVAQ